MEEGEMLTKCRIALALGLGAAVLVTGGQALAGQFKRLSRVATLAVGAQATAFSSPQNQGAAMEMDVWEYLSAPAGASYRCRITSNSTGRQLRLARVGVNATIQASCITPVNGTCDLPFVAHTGNLLFQCIVATGNGSPVTTGSTYGFAVQRQPLVVIPGAEAQGVSSRSGLGPQE
jgi:hypothetical protein